MKRLALALSGGLLLLVSPGLFFKSCSDHCASGGISLGGYEIARFVGVVVSYCTNGSECTMGMGPVLLPLGLVLLGLAFVRR